MVLRLHILRCGIKAKGRRLLCILLLCHGAVPAYSSGRRVLLAGIIPLIYGQPFRWYQAKARPWRQSVPVLF